MKAVSKTAYYCCGVRMQDAESSHPLVGDVYAKRLLGSEGIAYWEEFRHFKWPNAGNTVRHYLIDSFIKKELNDYPDTMVILIGAGLDSRAYRINGGKWVEIDEAGIIEYKNIILPINECKNPLTRIAIDFEKEKLKDKLAVYTNNQHVVFVIEGVLMYLTDDQKNELLTTLTTLFPIHTLFCDLMNKKFFEKFSKPIYKKLAEHEAVFKDIAEKPADLFLIYGYTKKQQIAILHAIHDVGLVHIPWLFRKLFLGRSAAGYSVYHFTHGK